jgi:hypothetical protein
VLVARRGELTVLKLNGPWYDGIPADVRADPSKGWNEYWVRHAPGESR